MKARLFETRSGHRAPDVTRLDQSAIGEPNYGDSAKGRRAVVRLAIWLVAALALTVPARAGEKARAPIALVEVGAGDGDRTEHTRALREALEQELDQVDFGRNRPRQRYVLSASLLKLDSVAEAKRVRATCVVSVALRRMQGSTLEAIIHGRATAEQSGGEGDSVKTTALRAAVHSAIRRVPETLRASER